MPTKAEEEESESMKVEVEFTNPESAMPNTCVYWIE